MTKGADTAAGFRVRRIYGEADADDGVRVLVDRLWPRGVAKARAAVDEWCKELTPSTELRTWFHAHPDQYADFAERYRAELAGPAQDEAVRRLRELARTRRVTLLTAVKDPEHSHVPVLLGHLTG
ncbi:Uncharacterized conserved protein YeaO, DUF488 family [Actinacidiphila alni]|uniref:Uncharacterized conserved protein YeaO, DUF488 family n=1 Tax=Actinacidiphila alni TaxID=380248 RepID=A0A1I2GJY5_9ACTN|nr:DUF488 family protein [Actinacidiphila alni]SFF17046.1 Uncharacterized conserved protein YeaO, DUF488 family [Actinacidiphila alni]